MKHVYCICGLGADERIFSKINWPPDAEVHYLQWLKPERREPLQHYARRMSGKIHHPSPILVGVSFGGMMCVEISKLICVEKIVLISSITHCKQLPLWMRTCGRLKLDYLLPRGKGHNLRILSPVQNYFLGAYSEEEKRMAEEYRDKVDPDFLKWSIHAILNWKNRFVPENCYLIHGSDDRVFPTAIVKPTHTIRNAGHFLVFQRADAVSRVLQSICS